MKTIALISTVCVTSLTPLMAQGQSDFDALRSRVDSAERRINILERELIHLRGGFATEATNRSKPAARTSGEYVVVKGDSLSRIAKRHNMTVTELKRINDLRNDHLRIGQKLIISGGSQALANKSVPRATEVKEAPVPRSASKHKVRRGETFYSIARQHGISVSKLMTANPSVRPTSLRVGQALSIDTSRSAPIPAIAKSQSKSKAVASSKPRSSYKKPAVQKTTQTASTGPKPAKKKEPAIRTITVNQQMTYGQFASKYGASTTQLNALNGLNLNKSTMLAKGSELYVPQY